MHGTARNRARRAALCCVTRNDTARRRFVRTRRCARMRGDAPPRRGWRIWGRAAAANVATHSPLSLLCSCYHKWRAECWRHLRATCYSSIVGGKRAGAARRRNETRDNANVRGAMADQPLAYQTLPAALARTARRGVALNYGPALAIHSATPHRPSPSGGRTIQPGQAKKKKKRAGRAGSSLAATLLPPLGASSAAHLRRMAVGRRREGEEKSGLFGRAAWRSGIDGRRVNAHRGR